jgi:hypothetical protein
VSALSRGQRNCSRLGGLQPWPLYDDPWPPVNLYEFAILPYWAVQMRATTGPLFARTKPNHTVWLLNSNAARPDVVQQFCKDHGARQVIFVSRRAVDVSSVQFNHNNKFDLQPLNATASEMCRPGRKDARGRTKPQREDRMRSDQIP